MKEKYNKQFCFYDYYFSLINQNKKESIKILQKLTRFKENRCVNLELISNHIFYKDYKGALKRLKLISSKDSFIDKLEIMLNIKCKNKNELLLCKKIIKYLKNKFDINLYYWLRKLAKKCDFKYKKETSFIRNKDYIDRLNIKECLFLSNFFTNTFLQRRMMVCYPCVYDFTEEYFKKNCDDEELKNILKKEINFLVEEGIFEKKERKINKFDLFDNLNEITSQDYFILSRKKIKN
ncbi:hypothetical protein TUBRATIS_005840 [Tubulinosema ratisbonensis]|uniref:Uncharacterized protein n=1 Tax=Tubulinosema ratisbonensis TaxID=291195 RepID=A0A437AP44_9MICR|nr:hypothetical protein TUBRATIS_005840 [Tubulinosema ratisbonensis]